MKLYIIIALLLCTINSFSQKCYVFFGSFNHDKNKEGLYVYELDTVKGTLKYSSSYSGTLNPSYITLSPDGNFLYACTESKTPNAGSVSSFKFDSSKGILSYLNSRKSGGENPVYLTTDNTGKWLINGNYTEAGVSVYPLANDGTIMPAVQTLKYSDGSNNSARQEKAHIHSTIFSPDGKLLFVPDLGADQIRSYTFNRAKHKPLSEQASTMTNPASGPRHFVFHPNGKFAYCIEELSGMVSAYSYTSGKLTTIGEFAAHPDSITEGFESSDIHISPDGKFLYASNRGQENNISIFLINDNGALETKGYQPTLGLHPRTFAIDPSGNFLIVANVNSSSAVVFRRDVHTGLLTKTDERFIEHVTTVKIKDY